MMLSTYSAWEEIVSTFLFNSASTIEQRNYRSDAPIQAELVEGRMRALSNYYPIRFARRIERA